MKKPPIQLVSKAGAVALFSLFSAHGAEISAVASGDWTVGATWSNSSPAASGNTYVIDGFTVVSPTASNTVTFAGNLITVRKTGGTAGVLDLARLHASTDQTITTTLPGLMLGDGTTLQFRAQTGFNAWNVGASAQISATGTVIINNTGGSYGQNINLSGPVSGTGVIQYKTANSPANTSLRTLALKSSNSAFSGNWFVQGVDTGDDFGCLQADAVNALGTGSVTVDTRAKVINNAAGGINSIASLTLQQTTASLVLNGTNAWNNPTAVLNLQAGTASLGKGNSGIGTINQTGGTLELDLVGVDTSAARLVANGNYLCSGGQIKVVVDSSSATGSPIPLVRYTGILSGTPAITLSGLPGLVPVVNYGTGNNSQIDVTLAVPPHLIWSGSVDGNWNTSTPNWLNLGTPSSFSASDHVTFDDSASGTSAVIDLSGDLSPSFVVFNNSSKVITLQGGGRLIGSAGITKSGSGTAILAGNNSISGETTVASGNLQIGNGGTTGSLGDGNIVNNATLTFNHGGTLTLSNLISGTGQIVKNGAGTVLINNQNTCSGGTSVLGGKLAVDGNQHRNRIAPNTTVNISGAGSIFEIRGVNAVPNGSQWLDVNVTSGGTLRAVAGASTAAGSASSHCHLRNITLTGSNIDLGYSGSGSAYNGESFQLNGSIYVRGNTPSGVAVSDGATTNQQGIGLSGTNTISVNDVTGDSNADFVVAAELENKDSGANGFTKDGAGTMSLTGINSFTGVATINAGTVSVAIIGNGGVAGNLGQATAASSNLILNGGILQYTGATASTDRGMTFNANSANGLDVSTESSVLTVSGSLVGAGGFAKSGDGILLVSGTNTYSGATVIKAGTLKVGATASIPSASALTLTGGTLDLNGQSVTVASLTLNGSSAAIDFGSSATANTFRVTGASATTWPSNLVIKNFDPATDQLFFGSNAAGTGTNLSRIIFLNPVGQPAGYYQASNGANGQVLLGSGTGGAPFTPGNIVIFRAGDGISPLSATGNPVFLDEYSPAGSLIQSIPMPTALSGANRRLVITGNATAAGDLNRSLDGRFITLTGYDSAVPSASSLTSSAASTVYRTIGRISHNAVVDTSTFLQDFADGGTPRSVVSRDGSAYWLAGSTGGIRHASHGATTTSTQLSTTISNLRTIGIYGDQMYAATASGTAVRVGTAGSGTPTTSGNAITNLPGYPISGNPQGFFMADLSPSVTGIDTLYVADEINGLGKYSLVGGNWVSNGVIGTDADDYRGLTGSVSGSTVRLYTTRKAGGAGGGGELVTHLDDTGFNAPLAGTPTLLATAAANTAFRGVSFAPVSALPPIAATGTATSITTNGVTLNGTVNPNSLATTAVFEYGADTSYGSSASVTLTPDNGATSQAASVNLAGLQPVTTYHYRISATNSAGTTVGADGVFTTLSDFTYQVAGGTVTITGYTGPAGSVVIPSHLGGLPVTGIGNSAFQNMVGLTGITIPNSVTSIGNSAFLGCTGLSNITLPNGLLSIGDSAFQACISLTAIVVPDSVTSIGTAAFKSCNALASATLPAGLTLIPDSLFHSCVALSQVNIPATVTSIGNSAFQSCWSLTAITFPNGLTTIGSSAFAGCRGLTTITIPSSVTSIGSFAFSSCPQLSSAYFQGNAPTLGTSVFEGFSPGAFTVYFVDGANGFTSPTWQGYPSVELSAPAITNQPASQTITSGATATLSVTVTGNPPPTLQWYRGTSGDTANPVSGATAASFTTPSLTTTTSYWVRATNSQGTADSGSATITVTAAPTETHWTGTADHATWLNGGNWDAGTPTPSLRAIIDTSDSVTLSSTQAIDSLDLRSGQLTLASGAELTTSSSFDALESFVGGWDDSPATLTLSRGSSALFGYSLLFGGPGNGDTYLNYYGSGASTSWPGSHFLGIHYSAVGRVQWNFHVDRNLPFAPIDTSGILVPEVGPSGPRIRLHIENIGTPLQPGDFFPLVSYGFRFGSFGATADGSIITNGQEIVSDGYRFSIEYDDVLGLVSATVLGTEASTPVITTQPASQTISSGATATLSIVATGSAPLTYQWYLGNSGDTSTPVGTNSASFTTPALTSTTSYWVKVMNSANPGGVDSAAATITVETIPPVVIDGHNAPAETYQQLAVQSINSNGGAGNVLANLHARQSLARLNLFLGGRASGGNCMLWFFDTKPGGPQFVSNSLITSGGEEFYINNLGTSPFSGMRFENGFEPDYAIRIYGLDGDAHVNLYDLRTGFRTYLGNAGTGNRSGGIVAEMRADWRNVTTSYGQVDYGVELALNVPSLGLAGELSEMRMMAMLVNADSLYAFNQFLHPLPEGTDPGTDISSADFQQIGGTQTISIDVDNSDSDGDGTPNTIDEDDDNDGLPDTYENSSGTYVSAINTGTNPLVADTDHDGYNDGAEVAGSGLGFISNPNIMTFTSMAVAGDFTPAAWNVEGTSGNTMTRAGTSLASQNQWLLDYHFPTPNTAVAYKFAANASWNNNWGNSGTAGTLAPYGGDLTTTIGTSGIHRFVMNHGSEPATYSFERVVFPSLAEFLTAYGLGAIPDVDSDGDGLTNAQEFTSNTDPHNPDSDGNGIQDFIPLPPQITTQPVGTTIAYGTTAELNLTATGTPAPEYQWYQGNAGDTSNPVPGANSATFTTPALTSDTTYWARVSNAYGSADSGAATITVLPAPAPEIVVEEPAGTELVHLEIKNFGSAVIGTTGTSKTFVVRNTGNAPLENLTASISPIPIFELNKTGFPSVLAPGESASITVTLRPTSGEGVRVMALLIRSNDLDEGNFVVRLSGTVLAPPAITAQPVASQNIIHGTSTILGVTATGYPAPTFQWYQGLSGDTTNPMPGATSPAFTTPSLTASTRYWVRASNEHGSVDSDTSFIEVDPISNNATLSLLTASPGNLSPTFNSAFLDYTVLLPSSTSSIQLTPYASHGAATISLNGQALASGATSAPIALASGDNLIPIVVTAQDQATIRSYQVNARRLPAMTVNTGAATAISSTTAQLNGTVTPNSTASTIFQYGTDTNYGYSTPLQAVDGNLPLDLQSAIIHLIPETTYHFRLVANNGAETVYGPDQTFETAPGAPLAVTGNPVGVTTAEATLVGAVDAHGLDATVRFEYGPTVLLGSTTPIQTIPAGTGYRDVLATITGLTANAEYRVRLVATSTSGTNYGEILTFRATASGGGTGTPTAVPTVATGEAVSITTNSVELRGSVDSKGGVSVAFFEYGTSPSLGLTTGPQPIGDVDQSAAVSIPFGGLQPGTQYFYRIIGQNSLGATPGDVATFTTAFLPPYAATGGVSVLSNTSVRVSGTVNANRASSTVRFRYGTDPSNLDLSVDAVPASVSGDSYASVTADLVNLQQGTTWFYRIVAGNSGGETEGSLRSFDVEVLSGLDRRFPDLIDASAHQGSLRVDILPAGIGGWRFAGEIAWRQPGSTATGLAAGDRLIQYRPAPGFTSPAAETLAVTSGSTLQTISRSYSTTSAAGNGRLQVFLKPDSLSTANLPTTERAQWRFLGESDAAWRDSGAEASGLAAGNHLVETKPLAGYETPAPVDVIVADGRTTVATITYFLSADPVGTAAQPLPFSSVSSDTAKPYGFVGQILSDVGASSGFVVKPRVVATAGHVVFDDGTLSSATGLQWLFQRDAGVHEPIPVIPRGYFLMTGYEAQRAMDNSPGVSSPASQNLDAAALYFSTDEVGRNGYSGFLASDLPVNEYVVSDLQKTLVGYPVEGVTAVNSGRMHATPPAGVAFDSAYLRTYTTAEIRGSGGMSGGPLCVRTNSGTWYPAGIFLGGTRQTVIRAIDSDVADLFGFAEAGAGSGNTATGGSGVIGSTTPVSTPALGAVRVIIEPAAARSSGARWRISSGAPYENSGAQIADLSPNTYTVQFSTVPGFLPPTPQPVSVTAGRMTNLTFTYEEIIMPPVITSPSAVTLSRGQSLLYQITTSPSADGYTLFGALPSGVEFNAALGRITGIPQNAGNFVLQAGASNAGGSGSKSVTFTILPVISAQSVSAVKGQPLSHALTSGETGDLIWSATGLPDGLSIHPSTGVITGTPNFAGLFTSVVSITKNGVTAGANVTFTISGSAPVFTLEPPATRAVEFATGTTFTVAAGGEPVPSLQWYRGSSGNTAQPVVGATSATFSTPALTEPASYWVRATNLSGNADSRAVSITLLPSSNPELSALETDAGTPSPNFNPAVTSYRITVPNSTNTIRLLPYSRVSQTVILVNGMPVASGAPSPEIPVAVGVTRITVDTTAGNGTASTSYTLDVTRLTSPAVATGGASGISYQSAVLNGTVTPNGPAQVFFEYGTTTAYGKRTDSQGVSGSAPVPISHPVSALAPSSPHHFRIVLETPAGTFRGADQEFTTTPEPPTIATGAVFSSTTSQATLTGAVNPHGLPVTLWFEYGLTDQLGGRTADFHPSPDGGTSVEDVSQVLTDLIPNNNYSYRLVGSSDGGVAYGAIEHFTATTSSGTSDGKADSPPTVATGIVDDQTTTTATLRGSAYPNDGSTEVWFEYGLTNAYGQTTAPQLIGNGNQQRNATSLISGLEPAKEYHFRIVGRNIMGTTVGQDAVFQTVFNPPVVTIGKVEPVSSTSVMLSGTVDPRGAATAVDFLYGDDGTTYPFGAAASQGTLTGTGNKLVSVVLTNLEPSRTYQFVIEAVSSGGTVRSEPLTFQPGALMGLIQEFPQASAAGERSGQVNVTTLPTGTGGWRFQGETQWRVPGTPATGLTTADRLIEFKPVSGFIRPPSESVSVVSGQPVVNLEVLYYPAAEPGTGAVTVNLEPASISDPSLGLSSRAQWRFAGVAGDPWRDSGVTVSELPEGAHLIECKAIPGRQTPLPRSIELAADENRSLTFTYFAATAPIMNPPSPISYDAALADARMTHAYVGQVRGDNGSSSGFAVKRRVVATAAQAVFDEATLSVTGNIEWLWLPDRGVNEPRPLSARGVYTLDGYAAQRASEGTPGTLSNTSQNLNVATLYFTEDVARGGSSGFVSSDDQANPHLVSSRSKTLAGYPVAGISASNTGRLHVTNPSTASVAWVLGRTFDTPAIRGYGGMAGGPLSVQPEDGGSYYPAGIYVGGTTRGIVRAIDSSVIDLFSRAEVSGNGGDNNTGGGITHSAFSAIGSTTEKGAVTVKILPAAARNAGAGWRLSTSESYRQSDGQLSDLSSGSYVLYMRPVDGFPTPPQGTIKVKSGQLTEITFDYSAINTEPTIAAISNRSINEDGNTGVVAFTIGDAEIAAGSLIVTRSSSNTALVPNANIVLGGSGANRTVTVTPAANQSGTATITITVSDGTLTASEAFTLTVNPVNDAPTVSAIANQNTTLNTAVSAIPFTIADVETTASSLILTKASSNPTLLPVSNIVFGGSGTSRTVTLTPVSGQLGSTTVTLTVGDGTLTTSRSFILTVTGTPQETWRFANFGNANNSGNGADSSDTDGDGQSNTAEYAAGTDPNNPADVFRVLSTTHGAGTFTVTVPGKMSRTYILEHSDSPSGSAWTVVTSAGPQPANGELELTDPAPAGPRKFYRVSVSAP